MNSIRIVFVVTLLIREVCRTTEVTQKEVDLRCTEQFCEEYIEKFSCPRLNERCFNTTRRLIVPSPTPCNCCEHCLVFQEEGEACLLGRPGQPPPDVICAPGTECVNGICRNMTKPDVDFYPGYECENGECRCSVLVDHVPRIIFGKFQETAETTGEKQCGCSAFAYRAQETIQQVLPFPHIRLPVPRCLPNGQYDPLQCIDEMCGCVNRSTGVWDKSKKMVHYRALGPNNPKCFDPLRHIPGEYYTVCEKERNEFMKELFWTETDNIELIITHIVKCTPDGNYETSN